MYTHGAYYGDSPQQIIAASKKGRPMSFNDLSKSPTPATSVKPGDKPATPPKKDADTAPEEKAEKPKS